MLIGFGLPLSYLFLHGSTWQSSIELHTLMEVIATFIALMIGGIALVRYYSKPDPSFLILGAGFIGTAILDSYHTLVTLSWFKNYLPPNLSVLIPWSSIATRLFLSLVFLTNYIVWQKVQNDRNYVPPSSTQVYLYTLFAILSAFVFFIYRPLSEIYSPDLFFHRLEGLLPTYFFSLALWGYLKKGAWRYNPLEHWLVIAIIINIISQLSFMLASTNLFDMEFVLAHMLKKLSYLCILFGLFINTYHSFTDVELKAHYDVLTQLPNRTLFADRLMQAIAHSNRNELMFAVCFLDLDNFKPVNDTYGHAIGDQLLIEVARRIQIQIRKEDTVSRHGGDEFSLLLGDIKSVTQCEQMLKRIHKSLAKSYLIEDHTITISASSGITLYPLDTNDLDTLLHHADQAMYQAKFAGRNRYRMFNTKDVQLTVTKYHHLQEIRNALLQNELTLYYQPKINMKTGAVYSAEALIRWIHPEKGLILPLDFLPLIGDTDLEIQIGHWVIDNAVRQLDEWRARGINCGISINISPHHLQSSSFITQLDNTLTNYPMVDANDLQLEILETSALSDLKNISRVLKQCRNRLGVQIALDDFGTGYSSLTHLRNLPVDTIKIDQTFVCGMLDFPNDYAIIEGIIGLTDAVNYHLIAEGVETMEHGLMLLVMGCVNAQGYSIARPMPANKFPTWLDTYNPHQQWLTYANCSSSPQEQEIKLFQLTLDKWVTYFETNILAPPQENENWPIMAWDKCHMGLWLERAKRTHIFKNEDISKLQQTYNIMHLTTRELLVKYQSGNLNSAREGLKELHNIIDTLNTTLSRI